MARKKANNQWYIVWQEHIVDRKYLVEATSAREARKMGYDELLGCIDEDDHPKTTRAVGFPTKEEALDSEEAWVEWHA
jgi:hypothetical protein